MSEVCHPICIYSVFGMGKTSLIAELAEELLEPGEKMRLITAEHVGSIQETIDNGLIEVWKINNRDYPFETLRFAADGYWPKDLKDPKSPLVPPTADTWTKYPIRVFEGMATLSNYLAGSTVEGSLSNRIGKGEKVGPTDSGELVRLVDNETGVGSPSRSNFGFIQREMTGIIQRSQKHPGIVIWTSHEDEVKEKRGGMATGKTIAGPEVFGGALTTIIGREFSDVWHIVGIENEVVDESGIPRLIIERKIFVKPHLIDGATCLAKNSGSKAKQASIPDCFAMTKDGMPMMDVAKRLTAKLWHERKDKK